MKAPKSYEEGMERLNAILAKMQDEQTTLAEAVKLYAEAASLMEYCHTALEKTSLQIEEIDAKINEVSEGWKTGRMGKVDLTLIRLAVYEMLYEEDVPAKVAINEAVELAKQYGTDNSPSFVNGVLAKLV
jgi:N utilization substance protein B